MTLTKLLAASLLSFVAAAQATVVVPGNSYGPGNSYQPYPQMPYEPARPERPGRPGRPDPIRPDRPGRPGGQVITREARIARNVRNETLNLRRLADIDRHYRGFTVNTVTVIMRPNRFSRNASLELLINRRIEDSRSLYQEPSVTLHARGNQQLGEDVNTLQLRVRGDVFIEGIRIELSEDRNGGGWEPNPPGYGREMIVDLPIPGYLPPQGHIDLTRYIDIRRYAGHTVEAVEITANARYNAALIDVLFNGYVDGTISLGRYSTTERVYSRQRLVIGSTFGNLILAPRGDSNLTSVRLILRR